MVVAALVAGGGCNQIFGIQRTELFDASDGQVVQVVIDGPRSLTIDPVTVTMAMHFRRNHGSADRIAVSSFRCSNRGLDMGTRLV